MPSQNNIDKRRAVPDAGYSRPVVIIGTVSLDTIHFWDANHDNQTGVQFELGGVGKHVACVLGALGQSPYFVSARFTGEMGQAVSNVFMGNQVIWQPLDEQARFSSFEAHIDSAGQVFTESFVVGESLALLTPDRIRRQPAVAAANVLVGCTNLTVAAMQALVATARTKNAPFWLVTSSNQEAPRLRQLLLELRPQDGKIDLLSLNREELELLVDHRLETVAEIAAAASNISQSVGHCLVTLGSQGALLADYGAAYVDYQAVVPISGRSPVGGGDCLFASLLAARLQGQPWAAALNFAAQCTRRYLLRDMNSMTPYASLRPSEAANASILSTPFPAIEKVFLNHDH